MEQKKESRWLKRRYRSAQDVAEALIWYMEASSGTRDMGVDYEQMAQSLLDGGYPTGGGSSFVDLVIERKREILGALAHALSEPDALIIFRARRIWGWKKEKTARHYDLSPGAVEQITAQSDQAVEDELRARGLF